MDKQIVPNAFALWGAYPHLSPSSIVAPKTESRTPGIVQQEQRTRVITTPITTPILDAIHPEMQPKTDFSFWTTLLLWIHIKFAVRLFPVNFVLLDLGHYTSIWRPLWVLILTCDILDIQPSFVPLTNFISILSLSSPRSSISHWTKSWTEPQDSLQRFTSSLMVIYLVAALLPEATWEVARKRKNIPSELRPPL